VKSTAGASSGNSQSGTGGNSGSSPSNSNGGSAPAASKSGGVSTGAIIGIAVAVVVLVLGLAIVGLLFYRSRGRAAKTAGGNSSDASVTADAKTREVTPPRSPQPGGDVALAKKAAETIDPVPPYDELDGRGVRAADAKAASPVAGANVPYPGMHAELAGREMHTPADWRPGVDGAQQVQQVQPPAAPPAGGSAAIGELPAQAARVELDGAAQQQQQQVYEVAGSGAGPGWQPGWVELPSGPDS
jgi:hypothetical protein